MKKIIIEIDDEQYEDAINDTEWGTLSLGVYLKEQVKNGKPLDTEYKEIKGEMEEAASYFANNGDTLYGIQVAIHILNNRTQGENKEN